jgi:hypothetical protein
MCGTKGSTCVVGVVFKYRAQIPVSSTKLLCIITVQLTDWNLLLIVGNLMIGSRKNRPIPIVTVYCILYFTCTVLCLDLCTVYQLSVISPLTFYRSGNLGSGKTCRSVLSLSLYQHEGG